MPAIGRFFFHEGRFRWGRAVLILLLILLLLFALTVVRILRNPESFLNPKEGPGNAFSEAGPGVTSLFGDGGEGTAPERESAARPKDNIVNILLLGVDATPYGGTSSGTMAHTDVVMLCAVNFDRDTVDLISIPRDTFTKVNGHRGIYRLNSVFNLGGGTENPRGGYKLMCSLAGAWMGGVEVSYYYAVDFQAVIDIVDAMGGVLYDAETCSWDGPNAVRYNGENALAYLRYRQHNEDGDRDRTGRQRAMLTAIFLQLKDARLLDTIPAIINASGNGIDTNTTLAQTAALVSFGATAQDLKINSRILDGKRLYNHDWTFSFPDPDLRASIISEVYGIGSEPVRWATPIYEDFLHLCGFKGMKYLRQAEKVFGYINANYTEATISEKQRPFYMDAYAAYRELLEAYGAVEDWYLDRYASESFSEEELAQRDSLTAALEESEETFRERMLYLADAFAYPDDLNWAVYRTWCFDPDINEIAIDFN